MNNEIEIDSFTPPVFSTLRGGMGHADQCYILQKTFPPCLFLGVVSYNSVMSGWWQGVLVTLGIIIKDLI